MMAKINEVFFQKFIRTRTFPKGIYLDKDNAREDQASKIFYLRVEGSWLEVIL